MAQIRYLGAFGGISVLASSAGTLQGSSYVFGTPGGGYAGLAAGAGWMKGEFELLGVPFEDRGRLTEATACFPGTSADMAAALSSLGKDHVARRLGLLDPRQL